MEKRGVSLVVSYAILIVVAVAISIIVYASLKLYLPSDKTECPEDIHLILKEQTCNNGFVYFNITNKGLFNVSALYVRMAPSNKSTLIQINENQDEILINSPNHPIAPGETQRKAYSLKPLTDLHYSSEGTYTIEIQPGIISGKRIILCENAVITDTVQCTNVESAPEP